MLLTKESILGAKDRKIEKVEVPEWNGFVFVRSLMGTERDAFEDAMHDGKGKINLKNHRARMAALAICDESGSPLFTLADVTALSQKNASVLERICDVAMTLSGMKKGDVENAAKNSEAGTNAGSTSV